MSEYVFWVLSGEFNINCSATCFQWHSDILSSTFCCLPRCYACSLFELLSGFKHPTGRGPSQLSPVGSEPYPSWGPGDRNMSSEPSHLSYLTFRRILSPWWLFHLPLMGSSPNGLRLLTVGPNRDLRTGICCLSLATLLLNLFWDWMIDSSSYDGFLSRWVTLAHWAKPPASDPISNSHTFTLNKNSDLASKEYWPLNCFTK